MNPTTVIAVCALVVSVFSTILAVWSAVVQRKHMRLSVRPIAGIPLADFQNEVGVFLKNKGLGPMRIRTLRVTDGENVTHNDILTHMPRLEPGVIWSNFHDSVDGTALGPDRQIELLLLGGDPQDPTYCRSRDAVRTKLATLVIRVIYEDLYGQIMEPLEERLTFFGRHNVKD